MFEYVDKFMSERRRRGHRRRVRDAGGMGATPFYTPCGEHHYGNAEGGRDGVPVRNELFEKVMNDNGYEISYNHELVKLVTEDSGKVTGAIFKTDNGYTQINAKKGVLLTTGDMAADREMMAHYNVSLSKIVRYNINTNDTGDGQKMGIWIGADMDEFACGDLWPFAAVMMDGTLPTTFDGTHFYAGVANLPVLMVDGAGPSPHGREPAVPVAFHPEAHLHARRLRVEHLGQRLEGEVPRGRVHGGGLHRLQHPGGSGQECGERHHVQVRYHRGAVRALRLRQGHLHGHVRALQRAVRKRSR